LLRALLSGVEIPSQHPSVRNASEGAQYAKGAKLTRRAASSYGVNMLHLAFIRNRILLLIASVLLLTLVACGTSEPQNIQENPLENPNNGDDSGSDNGDDSGGDDSGNDDSGNDGNNPGPSTQVVTVTYQRDTSDFLNPERGMMLKLMSDSGNPKLLSTWDIQQLKSNKSSVLVRVYNLRAFKNASISSSYLNHIDSDLAIIRNNGMKAVIHFAYNFNDGSTTDAPLTRVLGHLDQLGPILRKNVDVIAFMNAGFIGQWGEWHGSTNGLTSNENKKKVLEKILAVLPQERAVAVRYPRDKKTIYGTSAAITESIAFNRTNRTRTGHHNDCFVASVDDSGTYIYPYTTEHINQQKNYLSQENLFLPQSGETCTYNPPRSDCPQAMADLQKMRWSTLNKPSNNSILSRWQSQGCYSEMSKRLGYRYRLLDAVLPQDHVRGTAMTVKVRMTNEGFAGVYNARKLELVIRHRSTGAVTRYNINPGEDVRLYLPIPSETKTLTLRANVASTIAKGTYDLFLNLPDTAGNLYNRSSYSIRLANTNMWEASTGFNKLGSFTMK
jgi:hypothetical protein